jgi:TetR/AcrR family transcriptional regulator, transcriptional repressor for nem operon
MARTKPAGQRRADLLAAGQDLFITKGITATTLEDITSRAGVSKGLFYLYFRSKEDLVLALQDQFSCRFAERIRAATAGQSDWPAKLDATVQASFECYHELYDLHEVLFHHAGHGHDHANRRGRDATDRPDGADAHGEADGQNAGSRDAAASSAGGDEPPTEAAGPKLAHALRELLEEGVAAGAFQVDDPETTALLFYVITHAFDPGFHGHPLSDARLVQATQQLFRRAAGVAG